MFPSRIETSLAPAARMQAKRSEAEAASSRSSKNLPPQKRKLYLVLATIVISAGVLIWRNWPEHRDVPDELIGTWRTSDPAYADRFLEIGRGYISFGTGSGGVATGFIQEIESEPIGKSTLYTIRYTEDGLTEQCFFYFTPARENTIEFKNQRGILWTRVNDDG